MQVFRLQRSGQVYRSTMGVEKIDPAACPKLKQAATRALRRTEARMWLASGSSHHPQLNPQTVCTSPMQIESQ